MRRLSALVSAIALIAVLAACTSGGAPGWTYAPAPSITAAPSGAASGEPGGSGGPGASGSPAASAPASTQPSAGGSPAASGGAGAVTITAPVGAATSGFDPDKADAPANVDFQITFDNQDNQAPHNLVVQDGTGTNVPMTGDTAPFQGPNQKTYMISALAAGTYKFICQVHPTTMVGELTVK